MQIILTNNAGSYDITKLVTTARWSGGRGQCSRTLTFGLLNSSLTGTVDCSLGSAVLMKNGAGLLFSGYIFERSKSTSSSVIDITCFDRGIYLKRNKIARSFTGITPEAATASIAAEFGIATGNIAPTGIPVSRNFLDGYSLYDIITTLYGLAAGQNGKAYLPVFNGDALDVHEMGIGTVVMIEGGSNLIDASTTESAANLTNRVIVIDKNGNELYKQSDDASINVYGMMQQVLKQQDNADAAAQVAAMLKAAAPEQRITVNCLGNTACVTGMAVLMHEPYTNLYGTFYIDSDLHQWKNGAYTNKLTLALTAVMDEKSVVTAASASTGEKIPSGYAAKLERINNYKGG